MLPGMLRENNFNMRFSCHTRSKVVEMAYLLGCGYNLQTEIKLFLQMKNRMLEFDDAE
jgi:hypothetical protein